MEDENLQEPIDATNQEEELDLELELDDTEDVEAIKERSVKMETFARQTLARAKKAEQDLKDLKNKPSAPATQSNASIEETVLLANGMSEELLEELKAVSKVRGVSLLKAQNDPLFVAMKDNFEKEQKQKDASLPASRGSGQQKPKKTFNTPGLTEAERKEMFEAKFNR